MLLGLTGGIASGKSTVVNLFEQRGIPSISADIIAREIVEPKSQAWEEIVKYFGKEILLPNDQLDRKKLGDIIFFDSKKREKINEITHPKIIGEIMKRAKNLLNKNEHVLIDIPLLFETNSEDFFDLIIVVYTEKKIQLKRLMLRDNVNKREALLRINAQIDIKKKIENADIIIYNNKDINETEKQVDIIYQDIKNNRYK